MDRHFVFSLFLLLAVAVTQHKVASQGPFVPMGMGPFGSPFGGPMGGGPFPGGPGGMPFMPPSPFGMPPQFGGGLETMGGLRRQGFDNFGNSLAVGNSLATGGGQGLTSRQFNTIGGTTGGGITESLQGPGRTSLLGGLGNTRNQIGFASPIDGQMVSVMPNSVANSIVNERRETQRVPGTANNIFNMNVDLAQQARGSGFPGVPGMNPFGGPNAGSPFAPPGTMFGQTNTQGSGNNPIFQQTQGITPAGFNPAQGMFPLGFPGAMPQGFPGQPGPFGAFGQQQQANMFGQQQQQQQAAQFGQFGQQQQQQQQGVTPNFGPFNNVFEPQPGNDIQQGVQVEGLPQLPTQNQGQEPLQALNNIQPPTNVQFLGQTIGNTVTNQAGGNFINPNSAAQAAMTNQIGNIQGTGIPGAGNRQFTTIIRGNGGTPGGLQSTFAQQTGMQQINIPQLPGNAFGQAQNNQILAMQQQQQQQQLQQQQQQLQQNTFNGNQIVGGPILQQQNMLNQNLQNQIDVNTQALDNSLQATQFNSLQGSGTQVNNQILDVQQPVTNFNGNIQQQSNQIVNTVPGTGAVTGGNNEMVDWSLFNQRMSEWQNFGGQGAVGTMRGNTAGSPLSLNSVNVANFDTRTSRGLTPGGTTQFGSAAQG